MKIAVVFDSSFDWTPAQHAEKMAKEIANRAKAELEMHYQIAKALQKNGHEVLLFGITDDPHAMSKVLGEWKPDLVFNATEAFTNPTGNVLGAFLAAMLYDTVGPALLATLEPDQFQSTLDLDVRFLRPVRPGRIAAAGRVVRRVGDIAHLKASLSDSSGATIATATAVARVIPLDQARTAV